MALWRFCRDLSLWVLSLSCSKAVLCSKGWSSEVLGRLPALVSSEQTLSPFAAGIAWWQKCSGKLTATLQNCLCPCLGVVASQ